MTAGTTIMLHLLRALSWVMFMDMFMPPWLFELEVSAKQCKKPQVLVAWPPGSRSTDAEKRERTYC